MRNRRTVNNGARFLSEANTRISSFTIATLISFSAWIGSSQPALTAPDSHGVATGHECDGNTEFRIGSGIYDITGPAAGLGMMGYGQVGQRTAGIHFRLRSRAFVIESPCNRKRVVFVSTDLQGTSQAIKREVVKKLRATNPDLYDEQNVIISAIHNHSGPGGYFRYNLYDLTVGGFDQQNFDTIVDGIHQSIVRADKDLATGTIRIAYGDLGDTSINRSLSSYARNPADERARYSDNVDKRMTLLKLVRSDRTEAGLINWFAVHCTSMHNDNRLISGDNKGYASYLFERLKGTNYDSGHTFVAAFAQSDEGDATPNVCGGSDGCGATDADSTEKSGRKQYAKALDLYENASISLAGGVDYRYANVKMDDLEVLPRYTHEAGHRTCPAALGLQIIAGAADGPGIPLIGHACDKNSFLGFICKNFRTDCQELKSIVVVTGAKNPPWTPNILPLQLVRIGTLIIIAVPAEFTTMAGRRLINTVMEQLAPTGVEYAVIAGLSNAYASYVTTREEYGVQNYEGACTLFGPWTLAAYQQEFDRLALALRNGTPVDPGPTPHDTDNPHPTAVNSGEWKPLWKRFGDVHRDADAAYRPGQTVKVSFWAGHPRNDLRIQDTYLTVQREDGASWKTVATDNDWETRFRWRRTLLGSLATVEWIIPPGTSGMFRIRHDGSYKSDGKPVHYQGMSRVFAVGLAAKH